MTKQSDKQIFDVWAEGAENWNRAQQAWFDSLEQKATKSTEDASQFSSFFTENPFTKKNPFSAGQSTMYDEFLKQSGTNWEKCTEQYNDWLSATKQWFPESMSASNAKNSSSGSGDQSGVSYDYFDALKMALDPSAFFQLGSTDLAKAFQKLLNAPQFADIGSFENRMMQIMNDSSALQKASAEYQSLISGSWSKAFSDYMEQAPELFNKPLDESEAAKSAKDMIDQWLKIANEKLLDTQRSPEFLDAQKQLFKAATQCKEQQNDMIESWCEYVGLPSRAEVDDLHKKVHELTREVRKLKTKLSSDSNKTSSTKNKSAKKTNSK